jgi:exodeoxyribonuclease VII small subunit
MALKKPPVAATEGNATEPSFETALARLETIVDELEAGSLSLEESIDRYEEGVRLSRRLHQTLDEAEKRIERLVESDSGPSTQPMDLERESGDSAATEDELPF